MLRQLAYGTDTIWYNDDSESAISQAAAKSCEKVLETVYRHFDAAKGKLMVTDHGGRHYMMVDVDFIPVYNTERELGVAILEVLFLALGCVLCSR